MYACDAARRAVSMHACDAARRAVRMHACDAATRAVRMHACDATRRAVCMHACDAARRAVCMHACDAAKRAVRMHACDAATRAVRMHACDATRRASGRGHSSPLYAPLCCHDNIPPPLLLAAESRQLGRHSCRHDSHCGRGGNKGLCGINYCERGLNGVTCRYAANQDPTLQNRPSARAYAVAYLYKPKEN
jgi:hypothetical protein